MSSYNTSFALCAVHHLIANAIYRCSKWNLPSRITVTVTHLDSCLSAYKISVADTGPGICDTDLQGFYPLNINSSLSDFFSETFSECSLRWDGVVSITTTGIQEEKIRHYRISLKDKERPHILELHPDPKPKKTFSGTEVAIYAEGPVEDLMFYIQDLCEKISILQLSNIYLELCLANFWESSRFHNNETAILYAPVIVQEMSIEQLSKGTIDYISKFIYKYPCGSQEDHVFRHEVKIGKGQAGKDGILIKTKWIVQTCVTVLERQSVDQELSSDSHTSCSMKLFFFEDFCFTPLSTAWLCALQRNVDWAKFGFSIKSAQRDASGITTIDFEHSSNFKIIIITIHRYSTRESKRMGARSQTKQLKDALEEALRELKQAMPHLFLGAKAKKMQQCVPDLSKCLAGLITTSMDSSFKIECSKILDLPPDETNAFEVCIRKKMMSIIQVKDASQPKMLTYNDERNGSKYKEAEVKYSSESECEEWALDD